MTEDIPPAVLLLLQVFREEMQVLGDRIDTGLSSLREESRAMNARLDLLVDESRATNARLDATNARLDATNARLDATNATLANHTEILANHTEILANHTEQLAALNVRTGETNASLAVLTEYTSAGFFESQARLGQLDVSVRAGFAKTDERLADLDEHVVEIPKIAGHYHADHEERLRAIEAHLNLPHGR